MGQLAVLNAVLVLMWRSVLLSISIDKVRRQGVQWNLAAVLAVQLAFVVTGSCFGVLKGQVKLGLASSWTWLGVQLNLAWRQVELGLAST